MLGPFATTSRLTPIQQMSLAVLPRAACTSMSTPTTTTTRDRGDRYGPMEWAQLVLYLYTYLSTSLNSCENELAGMQLVFDMHTGTFWFPKEALLGFIMLVGCCYNFVETLVLLTSEVATHAVKIYTCTSTCIAAVQSW